MVNEKRALITNIFFVEEKSIATIKGLDPTYKLDNLEYPLYLNDSFIKKISFRSEVFLEKKSLHIDERAFECNQNLEELKEVDFTSNVLQVFLAI